MVSVCMAVYNGELFLKEQIESILKQLTPKDELVISDDASTDNSLGIIASFQDKRIRVFMNKKRLGPIYNIERALSKSLGEIIFISDQDDIWLPGKVRTCSKELEKVDLVLHDAFILKKGKRSLKTLFQTRGVHRGFLKNLWRNSYTGCCMAFKRSVLESSTPFPEKIPMHDQWIGMCAEKSHSILFLHEILIDYRIHKNNVTQTTRPLRKPFKQRFLWRYYLVKAFLSRSSMAP